MALLERAGNGRRVRYPTALTMLATAVLGLVDESIQILLPDRFFDIRDVFFNAVAEFMVVAARLAIPPQRRPGWRVWFMWLLATSIGWGWGVYWGWYDNTDPKPLAVPAVLLAGWLGVVVGGAAVWVLQWLVLRPQIRSAGWWVAASTVGWAAGMPFGDIAGPPGLGAVYGGLGATVMVWLPRRQTTVP